MSQKIELLEIHTDGGSRGNPGPAAIGVVAESEGQEIFTISEKIGDATNNVAEYTAVLRALEVIKEKQYIVEKIKFILDSELIVKQVTGLYKVKLPHLQELRKNIISLIAELRAEKQINTMSFTHVRREYNKMADSLVNLALDS